MLLVHGIGEQAPGAFRGEFRAGLGRLLGAERAAASGADQNPEPWPGRLYDGPNGREQDPAMNTLPDLPPTKMCVDDQASYASHEIAMNWNAPLVFLLAAQLPRADQATTAASTLPSACRFCGR